MIRAFRLSTRVTDSIGDVVGDGKIGVLSVHPDGRSCRVGCEFCYLGARVDSGRPAASEAWLPLLAETLERLDWEELAFALSEPDAEGDVFMACAKAARARGRPFAVTTTLAIAQSHAALVATDGVTRMNLSVDPRKGPQRGAASPERVGCALKALSLPRAGLEVVLIVSLTDERFADALAAGGLEQLLAVPGVDKVALNALKPPPAWCDRAFWLRTFARLRPLLARELDRRLFLDCYVAARLLGLGGCPARADLTPTESGALAFRSCVYQPAPDFIAADAATLTRRLRSFTPPAACPFPIV